MSNIYKEQQRAYSHMHRVLEKIPKSGVHRNRLVMEALSIYATSERSIQKYLDTMIESGALTEKDGILFKGK